jgi:ubiquinone/menaquinone biosynthesis C-methylase UbiE
MNRQEFYRQRYGRANPGWRTSVSIHQQLVEQRAAAGVRLLDIGCGHGDVLQRAYRASAQAIGLDPDIQALGKNSALSLKVGGDGGRLPFADASFDVITMTWVLEHVRRPDAFLAEIWRVLAPGGQVVFLTPNVWNYNVWLIRAVPNRLHPMLTQRLYDRQEHDTYPVAYRINSIRKIADQFAAAGFVQEALIANGDPSYISFTPWLFRLACWIEAALDRPRLRWARVHLIGVYRKA